MAGPAPVAEIELKEYEPVLEVFEKQNGKTQRFFKRILEKLMDIAHSRIRDEDKDFESDYVCSEDEDEEIDNYGKYEGIDIAKDNDPNSVLSKLLALTEARFWDVWKAKARKMNAGVEALGAAENEIKHLQTQVQIEKQNYKRWVITELRKFYVEPPVIRGLSRASKALKADIADMLVKHEDIPTWKSVTLKELERLQKELDDALAHAASEQNSRKQAEAEIADYLKKTHAAQAAQTSLTKENGLLRQENGKLTARCAELEKPQADDDEVVEPVGRGALQQKLTSMTTQYRTLEAVHKSLETEHKKQGQKLNRVEEELKKLNLQYDDMAEDREAKTLKLERRTEEEMREQVKKEVEAQHEKALTDFKVEIEEGVKDEKERLRGEQKKVDAAATDNEKLKKELIGYIRLNKDLQEKVSAAVSGQDNEMWKKRAEAAESKFEEMQNAARTPHSQHLGSVATTQSNSDDLGPDMDKTRLVGENTELKEAAADTEDRITELEGEKMILEVKLRRALKGGSEAEQSAGSKKRKIDQ